MKDFNLTKGQQFTLTESDMKPEFLKRPTVTARVGLAIDHHIKQMVSAFGVEIPDDKYSPYDFKKGEMSYDIKSFAKSTVTVSAREFAYASVEAAKGRDVCYLVFEQQNRKDFTFTGVAYFSELIAKRKICNSNYDDSFYFYTSNVKAEA